MTLSESINIAGHQQMLSQLIVKSYTQMLLNQKFQHSRNQMKDAITLFTQQLEDLEQFYSANKKNADGLNHLRIQWKNLKETIQQRPIEKSRLKKLAQLDHAVLTASDQVVLELVALSSSGTGHLINLAGRQRMLSQRITKFYLYSTLGLNDEFTALGLIDAAKEFHLNNKKLTHALAKTPQILQVLSTAKREWNIFEAAFDLKKGDYAQFVISRYSEKLLKSMDQVANMLASLPEASVSHYWELY